MTNYPPYHEKHKTYRPEVDGGGVWFPGKGGYPRDTSMFEDQPEDPGPDPLPDYSAPTTYRTDNGYGREEPHAATGPRYSSQEHHPTPLQSRRDGSGANDAEHVQFLGERPRGRAHTTGALVAASCLSFFLGGAGMLFTLTIVPALLLALFSA